MLTNPYLQFFNELIIKQDYFECHEILEEHWKGKPNRSKHDIDVMLIQISTGEYHYRRGNFKGASKCYNKALNMIYKNDYPLEAYGVTADIINYLNLRITQVLKEEKYVVQVFPLTDVMLEQLRDNYDRQMTMTDFKQHIETMEISDEFIIHKHLQRDREPVIKKRLQALQKRSEK